MRKRAFTLIELLVVIAIIGILISLSVSACNKGGQNAGGDMKLEGPVNDYAKVLSAAQAEQLRSTLLAQEKVTSNQIVILTVLSLDGEEIEPFANKIFHAWKLGQAGKDNGVLIVLATEERKMRIEVGKGLEGTLTDATASQIIRREMAPKFKAKDFAGGFAAAVTAINLAVKGEYKADGVNVNFPAGGRGAAAGGWPWWVWLLIIVGGIIVLLIFLSMIPSSGGGGSALGDIATIVATIDLRSGGGGDSGGSGYSGGGGDSGGGGASGRY
ncbi:MAG: TPM domain-containing protein [Candidatus Peribacteraceae bacterium]|nr:TPM domain-containing protein [Candidatus Peribacteraceae bacterium]MDD5739717.1 TPM domain-containing protein [Candidatus Peribacteraceae bacterium]